MLAEAIVRYCKALNARCVGNGGNANKFFEVIAKMSGIIKTQIYGYAQQVMAFLEQVFAFFYPL